MKCEVVVIIFDVEKIEIETQRKTHWHIYASRDATHCSIFCECQVRIYLFGKPDWRGLTLFLIPVGDGSSVASRR